MDASFCLGCDKRDKCKEICRELNRYLKHFTSSKQIWETLVDPAVIEKANYRRKERGRRKSSVIYDED